MITIIFNHDMFDEPYNQTQVKKGFNDLQNYIEDTLNEHVYYSIGERRSFEDMTDECVFVYHTLNLNNKQKQLIANYIKQVLTLKKTVYKDELPEGCIIFEKKDDCDCFTF